MAAYRYVVESVVGCEPISLVIALTRRTHAHDDAGIGDGGEQMIGGRG